MAAFEVTTYEKQDEVAYVTLNRPQNLNAYNLQMRDELYQILGAIRDDLEVKVAVFRGAGDRAFCAGADLTEFLTAPSPIIARQVRRERDVWGLFLSLPQPLIAALHGYVLGSGIEIALCCDIRIAADDARFGVPEMGLGIIPAAGGTQTLPRVVRRAAAMEMLLSGRWVGAEEARRMKLVNQVVPRTDLWPAAEHLARRIKGFSPPAIASIKRAVTEGLDLSLEEGLELESRLGKRVLGLLLAEAGIK